MIANVPSGGATKPVLIAIASTLAVSAICQLAYRRLIHDAEGEQPSKGACIAADRARPSVEVQSASALTQNAVLDAVLFNAALDARDAERAAREKAKVDTPAEEPAEKADEDMAVETSEEERLANENADVARLETRLGNEPVDPAWAPKLEQATAKAARASNLRLDGVTCRETLCRARMSHRDASTRDDDVSLLLAAPELSPSEAQFHVPPDDPGATVIYFSRKGQPLALIDPPAPPLPSLPVFPGSDRSQPQN